MTDVAVMRGWQRLRYRLLLQARSLLNGIETLSPVAGGVVIGVWVNALSDNDGGSILSVTAEIFDVGAEPAAWVTIVALLVFVARYAVPRLRRQVVGSTDQAIMLSRHFEQAVDPDLRRYHPGRIAWGTQLVLQSCPNIEDGWAPEDISLEKHPHEFRFSDSSEVVAYEAWLAQADRQRISGAGFSLAKDPRSFTDSPELVLRIQPVLYSHVRFFQEQRAPHASVRQEVVERVLQTQDIDFPHKFCLQAVVATSDGYVLLTHRSQKVDYHPGLWSCSIEEQLQSGDVREPDTNGMRKWSYRMLAEELGLGDEDQQRTRLRFLAVFLEADILNVSIASLVTLDMTRQKLDATMRTKPRMDYEYQAWEFVKWDQLAPELLRPTRHYHPSSGLRMLLAGIAHYGVHAFELRMRRRVFAT